MTVVAFRPPRERQEKPAAPPVAREAERALAGALLISAGAVNEVEALGLRAEHWISPQLAAFWRAATALRDRGQVIDPLTVEAELRRNPNGARPLTVPELVALSEACTLPSRAPAYAQLMLEASRARRAWEIGQGLLEDASLGELTAEESVARARDRIVELAQEMAPPATVLPTIAIGDVPDPGPIQWLVRDLWELDAFGFVGALPKSWKSFFVLQLALAVMTGRRFLDRFEVGRVGPVLMFNAEGGGRTIKRRLSGICRGLDVPMEGLPLTLIDQPVLRLDDRRTMAGFLATVEALRPALVILDPLRELHGLDENDSAVVAELLGPLRSLQQTVGCAVIIVHHNTKPSPDAKRRPAEQLRGTGALAGAIDSGIFLNAKGEGQEKRVKVTALHRDAGEPPGFSVRLRVRPPFIAEEGQPEAVWIELAEDDDEEGAGAEEERAAAAARERIVAAVRKSLAPGRQRITSKGALVRAAKVRRALGMELIPEMEDDGLLVKGPEGYALPPPVTTPGADDD